jgi:hypothetical protein
MADKTPNWLIAFDNSSVPGFDNIIIRASKKNV